MLVARAYTQNCPFPEYQRHLRAIFITKDHADRRRQAMGDQTIKMKVKMCVNEASQMSQLRRHHKEYMGSKIKG